MTTISNNSPAFTSPADITAKAWSLVAQYRLREFASLKVGSVTVDISSALGSKAGPAVEISWPSIGAVSVDEAKAFADAMMFATLIGQAATLLLAASSV